MAGRILIFDSVAAYRIVLRCRLSAACYTVAQADTLDDLVEQSRAAPPEAVLIDMDGDRAAALRTCRQIRETAETALIPVVLFSRVAGTAERLEALRAGAADLLPKPLNDELLLARLRRLIRQRSVLEELGAQDTMRRRFGLAEQPVAYLPRDRVAIVAPSTVTGAAWQAALREAAMRDVRLMTREEALAAATQTAPPDGFVVGALAERPGPALNLLSELRSRTQTRRAAIVLVLDTAADRWRAEAEPQAEAAAIALDLGADDVVVGGFAAEEVCLRLGVQLRRKRQADDLRRHLEAELELAVRDPLTGLHNRRYAIPRLEQIATEAWRAATPCAVLVLDLDDFKSVNDTHGHAAGDAVLVEVARRLTHGTRSEDLVARIGGEEFLVAMPEADDGAAAAAAERLARVVRATPVSLPCGTRIHVTASIGAAIGGLDGRPADAVGLLLERADLALYGAKAGGGDRITFDRTAA